MGWVVVTKRIALKVFRKRSGKTTSPFVFSYHLPEGNANFENLFTCSLGKLPSFDFICHPNSTHFFCHSKPFSLCKTSHFVFRSPSSRRKWNHLKLRLRKVPPSSFCHYEKKLFFYKMMFNSLFCSFPSHLVRVIACKTWLLNKKTCKHWNENLLWHGFF